MATDRETLATLHELLKPLHAEASKLTACFEGLRATLWQSQRDASKMGAAPGSLQSAALADLQQRIGDLERVVDHLLEDRDFNAVPDARVVPRGAPLDACSHGIPPVNRCALCAEHEINSDPPDRIRLPDGFMSESEQEEATREADTGFSTEFVRQLEEEMALAREAELRDGY